MLGLLSTLFGLVKLAVKVIGALWIAWRATTSDRVAEKPKPVRAEDYFGNLVRELMEYPSPWAF